MSAAHHLLLVSKKTNWLVLEVHLTPVQLMALLPYLPADPNDPQMVQDRYELADFALFVEARAD
jgi:hypothetical protein